MSLQHFQSDETLRAQRMTADEAAAVIALWQQEQTELTGLTDRPAVPDVAEGLDITVEDVQRLLEAVRTQRFEAEQRLAQEQELLKVRLAEEERRLAEIQQLRAELGREQVKPFWRIPDRDASLPLLPAPPQIETNDFLRGFLPGFVAIVVVVFIVLLVTALTHPSLPVP